MSSNRSVLVEKHIKNEVQGLIKNIISKQESYILDDVHLNKLIGLLKSNDWVITDAVHGLWKEIDSKKRHIHFKMAKLRKEEVPKLYYKVSLSFKLMDQMIRNFVDAMDYVIHEDVVYVIVEILLELKDLKKRADLTKSMLNMITSLNDIILEFLMQLKERGGNSIKLKLGLKHLENANIKLIKVAHSISPEMIERGRQLVEASQHAIMEGNSLLDLFDGVDTSTLNQNTSNGLSQDNKESNSFSDDEFGDVQFEDVEELDENDIDENSKSEHEIDIQLLQECIQGCEVLCRSIDESLSSLIIDTSNSIALPIYNDLVDCNDKLGQLKSRAQRMIPNQNNLQIDFQIDSRLFELAKLKETAPSNENAKRGNRQTPRKKPTRVVQSMYRKVKRQKQQ